MGRPPDGPERVERFEGTEETKRRARVILEVIAGVRSVSDACTELGVQPTRFEELRDMLLQGALSAIEPRPAGRPRQEVSAEQQEIARLQKEVQELRAEVVASHVREELAIGLPRLGAAKDAKKGALILTRVRQRKRPKGGSSASARGMRGT